MSKGLFREVSLEKLSSPEQLDELIKVTSTRAWLVLIAISCILISAVVWGFLGSIPTKIEGQGILINNGGVFTIQHHTSGQVIDVRFKLGDMVKKGDVVARIEAPELVEKINSMESTLNDMESKQQVDLAKYKGVEKQIKQLRGELDYKSQIVSQVDGRILEIKINKGSIIQPGESLISLEQSGGTVKMEAVIFVPVEQGGKILPGMEAQICPTTVNKEEYGFMLGRVVSVSEYPATTQSMMQTLGNENLVSMLAGKGASLMVRIDLITDSGTKSGYRWSSPLGPSMSFHSGTIIKSDVIVSREKPIGKVIPLFNSIDH
jgi:multidrug efflux pump subunit AcrA (membrane-fusion protein)